MIAILKRELRSYFLSPLGYVFMAVFLFLNAFFFVMNSIVYGVANVFALFSNVNVIFLFLISILTMRLLSEEKNKKTDQLLLTAPVKVHEIVLGKYLAAVCVFLISLAISLIFPIILFIFGDPALSECVGGYFGFILMWGALISIGLFISSLTENQMIAAILTFGVLLVLSFLENLTSGISNPILSGIVNALLIFKRYNEFQTGVLNLANVIYFLSFIFVFLFLTVQSVNRRRYS